MSKFDKASSVNKFKEVARASEEKANIIQIKMISNENLLDYPRNNEDLSYTTDLETSMAENGFTDPLEVTDYGMEKGKFTIISGNRRRAAGVKVGYTSFPCIIKSFKTDAEVYNYVLMSNAHRNSVADPLLYCKRYKMHETYLKESGFKGSQREEIAKRLGISVQTADRYNKFNNIILPVWDMVRDELVGMSSVMPMASKPINVQEELLEILKECMEQGEELTRPTCNKIFKEYEAGKKSYVEIFQIDIKDYDNVGNNTENTFSNIVDINRGKGVSVISVNPEPVDTQNTETSSLTRNNEVDYQGYEKEFQPRPDKEKPSDTVINNEKEKKDVSEEKKDVSEDKKDVSQEKKDVSEEKKDVSEEEKKLVEGENLSKLLSKLEGVLHNYYSFKDKITAQTMMQTMVSISKTLFEEIESITEEYEIDEEILKKSVDDLIKTLETYK